MMSMFLSLSRSVGRVGENPGNEVDVWCPQGVRQRRHVALRHGAFCVSRQHRLCRPWPRHTFFVLFMKGWYVYSSSVNNIYDLWITSNFPYKWHRRASTTSGCNSSPAKIFHQNSSGERRLTFIGKRIEEDNREAERTSLITAKATSSTQRPQTCTEAATK